MGDMRRLIACLFAVGFCLVVAQPAAAAMWLRIEVAGPITAGTPSTVTVTTVYLTQPLCAADPRASPVVTGTWYSGSGTQPSAPSFTLIAYPAGHPSASVAIPLTHRGADSPYFDGTVRFPSSGAWIVRMADPHWGDPESDAERCAGARIDVQVGPALGERLGWPWMGPAGPFVMLVAVLIARSRSATGRTPDVEEQRGEQEQQEQREQAQQD